MIGLVPMAINTPATGSVKLLSACPSTVFGVLTATLSSSLPGVPPISVTCANGWNSIFSVSSTCAPSIFSPLNSSLLWIRCTLLHIFDRYRASSRAILPPPTTATSLFLKNAPSHVAQYETPAPVNSSSPGTPSFLCFAPVAIRIAFVSMLLPSSRLTFL